MNIFLIILNILVKLVAIILLIIIFILLYPFKYKLIFNNNNGEIFSLYFNYLILKISIIFSYKPKFKFLIKNHNKVIVDTSVKKEKRISNSIKDTDFIKNKDLESDISHSKNSIKKLFIDSKRFSKNAKGKEIAKSANSIIDSLKKFLPLDFIYVSKKVINELSYVFNCIKPKKSYVDIKYNNSSTYNTGLVFAVAAPFYSILGDKLKLKNDKNSSYNVVFTGRPILITLTIPIIKLLCDKRVRAFLFKKK